MIISSVSSKPEFLGYIVHRALRTKYPIVSSREVPNFPEATVRVCLNGFNDIVLLPTLRELLCEREIHVIELNQAVEFCINVFKEESKREYDDEDTASNNKVSNKYSFIFRLREEALRQHDFWSVLANI